MVNEVLERIKFKDMYLNDNMKETPPEEGEYSLNPYIRKCHYSNALVLPIFQKVSNQSLILIDYMLNTGMCSGLKEGFMSNPKITQTVLFDNCGLGAAQTDILLQGLYYQENLRSLTIKNSEIGNSSFQILKSIITKPFPSQLIELSLISCKLSNTFQQDLFEMLKEQYTELQILNLIQVGINKDTVGFLATFLEMEQNCYLRQLDISGNYMPQYTYYMKLLKTISQSKM